MTKLFDQAIAVARRLPPDDQDQIARAIMQLAGADGAPPVSLSPEEKDAVVRSKAAAARGEFAAERCAPCGRSMAGEAALVGYREPIGENPTVARRGQTASGGKRSDRLAQRNDAVVPEADNRLRDAATSARATVTVVGRGRLPAKQRRLRCWGKCPMPATLHSGIAPHHAVDNR